MPWLKMYYDKMITGEETQLSRTGLGRDCPLSAEGIDMKKTTVGLVAMVACVLWASVFPSIKTLYSLVDLSNGVGSKMALAGMRFTLAGLVILVTYMVMNRALPLPGMGQWGHLLKLGVFQTGLLYGFMYIGYANVTGMKASVLSQSGIFIVIVLAAFFLHEKVGRFQWIGLAIGIAGILVVNVNQLGDRATLFTFTMNGEGAMILAGLFGSIGSVLARIHGKNFSPMILNGWQMTFGGLMLLCVGVVMNGGLVELPSLLSIVLFVHTIVVASVGFTLWYSLLKRVEIKEIVLYRLTIPVLGSVFFSDVSGG